MAGKRKPFLSPVFSRFLIIIIFYFFIVIFYFYVRAFSISRNRLSRSQEQAFLFFLCGPRVMIVNLVLVLKCLTSQTDFDKITNTLSVHQNCNSILTYVETLVKNGLPLFCGHSDKTKIIYTIRKENFFIV